MFTFVFEYINKVSVFLRMKQIKKDTTISKNKIKDQYFYGIGSFIANKLHLSKPYVRNVLNNKFPNRITRNTRNIKKMAEELMKDRTL